jgi:PAS domain S-box-containing protein
MSAVAVLHVNDDPATREIVELAVGYDPMFTLRVCGCRQEALAAMPDGRPDLILLDADGSDDQGLLARLQQQSHTAGVPIICLAATAASDFKASPMVAGVIVKPLDPARLSARICAIMCQNYRELRIKYRAMQETSQRSMAPTPCISEQGQGLEVQGLEVQGLEVQGLEVQGLEVQGLEVQGLEVQGLQVQGLQVQGLEVQGLDLQGLDLHGLVLKAMGVGVWDWNIPASQMEWSDRYKEILGLPASFPSSHQEFEARLHPEDRARTIAASQAHLDRRESYDVEYRLRKADGAYAWIHAKGQATWDRDGRPLRMVGAIEDITLRKRADERLRLVVESAPVAMVLADQFGEIALVNRQAEHMFARKRAEMLAKPVELLLPANLRQRHRDDLNAYFVLPTERPMGGGRDVFGIRPDGSTFPIEVGLTPIHTDEGTMVLAAVVDITLRKQAEWKSMDKSQRLAQQVADRTAQLMAANRELDEFAYAASHDLKAPLRVIENASKWLEEDLEPFLSGETRENMKLLRGRVARLDKLLEDLLQFSRAGRETGSNEIISGQELIDNVLAMLVLPEGFVVDVDRSFASIMVARMPLQQIMMNLISNAFKHHHKSIGRIEVTVQDHGSQHAFTVRDDGPGIPEQFHERIFQMFQTLKPRDRVEGSGMGLAIVRKQIKRSGGSLSLDSAEGKGSCFHFTLPSPHRTLEHHK